MTDVSDKLRVAVCIVTRRRQATLGRLLDSLASIRQPSGAEVTILVIDNDATGTSHDVVSTRAAAARWPIEYHIEATPGIPQARNAAISACYRRVDALVFIDDDEIPEIDWLEHLLLARERFAADVVTGPALPKFESLPPKWVVDGAFFDLPRYATGTERDLAFTNNVLVSASVFTSLNTWFDGRLQFTGGSDTHFFRRLHLAGYRIVWCDEALVHDCIPAARATARWLIQRAYRYGHTHAFIRVDLKQSTRVDIALSALYRLRYAASSLLHGIIGLRTARFIDAARETAYSAGMLANVIGSRYDEYQVKGES